MNEQQFREQLSALVALAKEQKMCISETQLNDYFPDVAQQEEQRNLLLDNLKSQKITVGEKADLDEFLSMEDKDYLQEYMETIKQIEVMEQEELEEVMKSAIMEDNDAQQVLLAQFLSQAVELAKLYAGQGVLLEDLIGEANLALTLAVADLGCLEPEGDVWEEVSGFLGKEMMDQLEKLINEEAEEKDTDQKIADKVNRVADVARELSEEMRRKVSLEEICSNSELTAEEVEEAIKLSGQKIDTIEMETGEDDRK